MKKLMNLLLVFCLLLPAGAAAYTGEEALSYEVALERFNIISLQDADELDLIAGSLKAMEEVGFAQQYMTLAETLSRLSRGEDLDFVLIRQTVEMLSHDLAFVKDYLTQSGLAALPFDALLEYIDARDLESQGEVAEAISTYTQAYVLDSLPRSLRLSALEKAAAITLAQQKATDAAFFTFEEDADGALIVTGYTGGDTRIVIPGFVDGMPVKLIGERAFAGNCKLSSVVILEGGEDEWSGIADAAFMDCSGLVSVTLASSTRYIGPQAFSGCVNLEEVSIPNGVTDINQGAFENCVSLHEIVLPDSLATLGEGIFAGCTRLTRARLPESVTTIDADVFLGCTGLTIIGSQESYAQFYADENGIPFTVEDTTH